MKNNRDKKQSKWIITLDENEVVPQIQTPIQEALSSIIPNYKAPTSESYLQKIINKGYIFSNGPETLVYYMNQKYRFREVQFINCSTPKENQEIDGQNTIKTLTYIGTSNNVVSTTEPGFKSTTKPDLVQVLRSCRMF